MVPCPDPEYRRSGNRWLGEPSYAPLNATNSNCTLDRLDAEQRKRIVTMWTSCLSCWFARFVLLACLVFAVTNALGSESAKPAETPEARLATWVRQGEKQAA